MAKYNVPFRKTGGDSVRQLIESICAAANPRRFKIYDLFVTNVAVTPADGPFTFTVKRVTGSATGTSVTPTAVDPGDTDPAELLAEDLITADHASFAAGTVVMRRAVNGRAALRFSTVPGSELIAAATASNGLSLGLIDVSTSQFDGDVNLDEL